MCINQNVFQNNYSKICLPWKAFGNILVVCIVQQFSRKTVPGWACHFASRLSAYELLHLIVNRCLATKGSVTTQHLRGSRGLESGLGALGILATLRMWTDQHISPGGTDDMIWGCKDESWRTRGSSGASPLLSVIQPKLPSLDAPLPWPSFVPQMYLTVPSVFVIGRLVMWLIYITQDLPFNHFRRTVQWH